MEKLLLTKESLSMALDALSEALEHVAKLKQLGGKQASVLMDNEELERSLRDSLIQRFEFCADLFWKYLKRYEEDVLKLLPEINAPRSVITTACKARIITEVDAETLLEMIKHRNFTSHIYKEEMANQISGEIPGYYKIMKKYVDGLEIN